MDLANKNFNKEQNS